MYPDKYSWAVMVIGLLLLWVVTPAIAEGNNVYDQPKIGAPSNNVEKNGITTGTVMRDSEMLSYCVNISDVASEARNSILKRKLQLIETDVDKKLLELAKKIDELRMWSKKRDEFLEGVNESLVEIFETMRPDAAALQFAEIGPTIASGIILKLDPKKSSAILTEMDPVDAAKVAVILTSALEVDNAKTN